MIRRAAAFAALLIGFGGALWMPGGVWARPGLAPDEQVLLFPACAHREADGTWVAQARAWVFEPEADSTSRRLLLAALAASLDLPEEGPARERLERRLRWFLVDNQRGKEVRVRAGGRVFRLPPTSADGHTADRLRLARCPRAGDCSGWAELRSEDRPEVAGGLLRVPPEGLSVISDIDDTVRYTGVGDNRRVLESTFLEPFRPVPGMAAMYRGWAGQGAVFHYVSSGPWQLYPELDGFLAEQGFPRGCFDLLPFRIKDGSFLRLLDPAFDKKYPLVERILAEFPGRRFILVGDSGEQDPEVYGAAARAFPGRVRAILIRAVAGSDLSPARMERAFVGLDPRLWRVFREPGELPVDLLP